MSNQDLFAAINMFKQSMGELKLQRTISGANEAVQQIRSSELNEQEKHAQLSNLSSQLTMQMAGIGAPATTIEQVAGAIGPKTFATANAMNMEGLRTGNSGLQAQAQQQQDFETNKQFEFAKIRATAAANPLAQARLDEQMTQNDIKNHERFSKTLDPTAETRSAFGKAALGIQRGGQLDALVGNAANTAKAANNLPPQMVYEMATGLAAMVKGGVPTDGDVKHFAPETMGMDKAKWQQYLTNGVKGAEAGEFVKLYSKTITREKAELQYQVDDTILKRAQGNFKMYKKDPELFKQTVADRMGLSPDDIIVDEKKRIVTTSNKQAIEKKLGVATDGLKQAYAAMKNGTPEEKAKAGQVFNALGIDPHMFNFTQAQERVKYSISRGLL
jgi:hypothetical protein